MQAGGGHTSQIASAQVLHKVARAMLQKETSCRTPAHSVCATAAAVDEASAAGASAAAAAATGCASAGGSAAACAAAAAASSRRFLMMAASSWKSLLPPPWGGRVGCRVGRGGAHGRARGAALTHAQGVGAFARADRRELGQPPRLRGPRLTMSQHGVQAIRSCRHSLPSLAASMAASCFWPP